MNRSDVGEPQRPPEAHRPRVLIADDHAFVRDSLVEFLQDRFDVVAAVADGHDLVEAAGRLHPDVIVTDISMPGLNGIEAMGRLRAAGAEARVIFLTLHDDADLADRLIRAGASGFVLKFDVTTELPTAIECVVRGETFVTRGLGPPTAVARPDQ
ncbi:MAG TPA: response regulator transcription factor [Vicinamibacterales bacterium]|jgi:DNA-binding NarL/FixJ family response regulator